MQALRDVTVDGASYTRGARFVVSPITAAILLRAHDARLTTRQEDAEAAAHAAAIELQRAVITPEPVKRTRRTYRRRSQRRDMAPEITK